MREKPHNSAVFAALFSALSLMSGCTQDTSDAINTQESAQLAIDAIVSIGDLRYPTSHMNELIAEIAEHAPADDFVRAELEWIKDYKSGCSVNETDAALEPVELSEQECIQQRIARHTAELENHAIALLVAAPLPLAVPQLLQVPTTLGSADAPVPLQRRPALAYSESAGVMASTQRKGPISVSNLSNATVIAAVNNQVQVQNNTHGPGVALSANGSLLLVTYSGNTELFSAGSGRHLRTLTHLYGSKLAFSRSGGYLFHADLQVLDFYPSAENPPTQTRKYPGQFSRYEFRFEPETNIVVSWNTRGHRVNVREFQESGTPGFMPLADYQLPRHYAGKILDVVLRRDDNSVYLLTPAHIIRVGPGKQKVRKVADVDIDPREGRAALVGDYLLLLGDSELKEARVFAVVNTKTGEYAYPDTRGKRIKTLRPLSRPGKLLMGSDQGIELFDFNPRDFEFAALEPARMAKEEQKHAAAGIPMKKSGNAGSGASIHKCKDKKGRMTFSDTPCAGDSSSVEPAPPAQPYASSDETADMKIVEKGKAGIALAVRNGYLRPANASDLDRWRAMSSGDANSARILERVNRLDKYVVLAPLGFKGGLSGGDSIALIVNQRYLTPVGDTGHSAILFSYSGGCTGAMCKF
jgi:hypothetical protein